MKKVLLFMQKLRFCAVMVLGMICSQSGYAQVSGYTFSTAVGTFTPITGGTTVGNTASSQEQFSGDPITPIFTSTNLAGNSLVSGSTGFPIGFNFNLGGMMMDRFNISTEGNIKLGSSTDPYSSLQSGNSLPGQFATNVISNTIYALQQNLMGQAGSSMKYITTGVSPNRVLTVEWLGFSRSAVVGDNLNFQIKLYETTNVVEMVYGSFTTLVGTTQNATVGIHGRLTGGVPAGPDFRKVGNTLTGVTMDAPVVATTNLVSPFTNERAQWRNGFLPTSGRTYTFTPAGVTCNFPVIPTASIAPGSNQCVMSWGAAAGATSYNVEYKATASGTWLPAPGGTAMAGTTITVTGLAAATSYDFRVQSNCNGTEWITMTRVNPGPGELCANAIPYGAVAANAGACTPTLVTAGLGNEGSATIGCSGVGVLTDVWYSFVAPSNGKKLIIETTPAPASNEDWAMQIYSSCGGAVVGCFDDYSGTDYRPYGELCQFDYTGGQTYYIRLMQMQFYGSGPTINLCVYEDVACPVVPTNNICASAAPYTLQPFGSCPGVDVNYTTENATPTIDFTLAAPSCNSVQSSNDVWVKFNTGLNTAVQFRYTLGDATSVGAQIYSGTCGTGTLAPVGGACYTTPGSRAVTGLTPNTDYYIRFWTPQFNTSPTAGTFTVCIQEAPDCPGGLGTGYTNIGTISGTYSSGIRTTCGKDDDVTSSLVNAACGTNGYFNGEDEVFQFQVPTTGLYQVVLNSNSSWVGIKIYSNCPFLGRGGACVASVGSSFANKNLSNVTLTAGIDYFMIIDQFAPPSCIDQYSFDILPNPAPPANDNCSVNAIPLTQGATCNYSTFSYSAGATLSSELGACAANDDDVWYKFTALTSDPQITISPSAGFYPVMELFTACGTTGICCSFNSNGAGLPVTLTSPTSLIPGNTYYIRVYHAFSGSPLTDEYDICITNGPVIANCIIPTGLETIEAEACGASTNSSPAFQPITNGETVLGIGNADCGSRSFDYFRVTTTQTGYITMTVNSEFPAIVRLMNDNAGTAGTTITDVTTTGFCGGNITVSTPGAVPAGNYWAYVLPNQFEDISCGSARNNYLITYSFTVNPPAPAINDNCANAITLVPCGPALNGSTLSATQSQAPSVCNGDQSNYAKDLWYKFTAVAGLQTITATSSSVDIVMEVHGFCGGASIACADAVGPAGTETISLVTVPGQTYLVRVFAYSTFDPVPGNISISVSTPGGWSGVVSNDWNVAGNWCSGVVPGIGSNVLIPNVVPAPVLQTAGNCANLTLLTGATINTSPATLNVRGNVLAQGNNVLTGSQPLTLAGTSGQAISGSLSFNDVRISNPSLAGISISSGNVKVNGVLSLDANTKLSNTGTGALTIVSNATTDGSIGVVGSGASITGNVTVERYLPFASTPGWHFFGPTTAGNTFSGWSDDFQIRAPSPLGGTNGVVEMSQAERATVFQFSEPEHNVKLDTVQKDGWRVPAGASLTPGKGFRVFLSPTLLANNAENKMENVGAVVLGNAVGGFSFPQLTRNEFAPTSDPTISNPSNRGWNLLSNPFPSAINWDAAGWTKPTEMNNAFFIYNGVLGGYRVYLGTGANPGVALGVTQSALTNPNLIPKGQAFFVKLTSGGSIGNPFSATLKASESVKSSGAASFVRTATASNNLRLRISKVGNTTGYEFDAMVRFMDGATEGFDQHMDAHFLRGTYESVAFKVGDEDMILSSLPSLDGYRVVPVRSFYSGQTGQFKFSFLELSTFPASVHIYLKDRVLNSIVDVRQNPSYTFTVATTNNFNSNDRFELVFSPTAITDVKPSINGSAVFSLYPNPSNGSKVVASMIGFENESSVVVTITDVLGKVVYSANQTIGSGNNAEHSISAKLAAGVYNVSCIGKNHKFTTKLVIE